MHPITPPTGIPTNATPRTTRLEQLRAAADLCVALERLAPDPDLHDEVSRRLHTLFVRIAACEAGGYTRAEIAQVVWPVRELVGGSPLFSRLQRWPRGYQGDFETLALLHAGESSASEGTLAHLLDTFLLRSPIALQYRNRVARQVALMQDALASRGHAARILVLGAGPAEDVRAVAAHVRLAPGQITLHDADPQALAWAGARLAGAGCATVGGDVLRALAPLAGRGPYDLVLAGAVLDELPDRHAAALLHGVHAELVAPGGRVFVGAAASGSVYRPCLEYLTDWTLVERTERELAGLCRAARVPAGSLRLERDATGTVLLAELVASERALAAA